MTVPAQSWARRLPRPIGKNFTASLGVQFTQEQVVQEGTTNDYSLLQLIAGLKYDNTDNLLDPRRGLRGSLTLTPTVSFGGIAQSNFLIGQASVSAYFDLAGNGRTVLAGRALIARLWAPARSMCLPTSASTGGSARGRGFRYQIHRAAISVQPPTGGTAVDAASIEYGADIGKLGCGRVRRCRPGERRWRAVQRQDPCRGGWASATTPRSDRCDWMWRCRYQGPQGDAFESISGLGHAF
jgi:outer membrane protein assembly factor BamA